MRLGRVTGPAEPVGQETPSGRTSDRVSRSSALRKSAASHPFGARAGNRLTSANPNDTTGAPPLTLLTPVFNGATRFIYAGLSIVWLALLIFFWQWWLRPEHVISVPRYICISLLFAWLTLLPAYFILCFGRAVRPIIRPVPGRVAMVVTKAPSEPFSVVRRTLMAMLAQDYPRHFDVWLADEDPSPDTLAWCRSNNVQVSSRKGIAAYHRKTWPRRTRCKEGNLAFFYDTYGYELYDFVCQMDADHVPDRSYLTNMIAPFADEGVGYVSAPSICDANADASWSARGRLHVEASMHGSMQAGYTNGLAPLCIGSHYAVRTKALKRIGGLGPELAEDHSTTLIMNANGWRGVHALDAIAHGDGPLTFADLATQEFQWARSVVTILLQHSRRYFPGLPRRIRYQFIFCQFWYPLFSIAMAAKFLIPVYALLLDEPILDVTFPQFVLHFGPLSLWLLAMAFWWRRSGTYRPFDAKILGWEGMLFLLVQWPWALLGTLYAVRDAATGGFVDFRITPKGATETKALPLRVLAPYIALSAVSGVAALTLGSEPEVWGFRVFAAVNAVAYAAVVVAVVLLHLRESDRNPQLVLQTVPTVAFAAVLFALPAASFGQYGLKGLSVLEYGQGHFRLTREVFTAVGAGSDGDVLYRFDPRWIEPDYERMAEGVATGGTT